MQLRDFADFNFARFEAQKAALTKAYLKKSGVEALSPKTRLGRHARLMVVQSASITAGVTAVSSYTNLLANTTVPPASFTTTPEKTPGINDQELQQAYQVFQEQYAAMQGTASQWLSSPGGGASIYSQLSSVPAGVQNIDPTVQYYLDQLAVLLPGSAAYEEDLNNLNALVGTEVNAVSNYSTLIGDFGQSMGQQTENIVLQCETGTIAEIIDAYSDEISSLNDSMAALQKEIADDNNKLIGDYVAIAAEGTTAIIGIANWWNPVGWFTMGMAAYGLYETSTDIMALNAEIAMDETALNQQSNAVAADTSQVSQLQCFATQVQGFDQMNAVAQQELITLTNLYNELVELLQEMTDDLENEDIAAASEEWTTIMAAAGELALTTLYTWPPRSQVYQQNTTAPFDGGVFVVKPSGSVMFSGYNQNGWTDTGQCAVNIVAAGEIALTINAAPQDGSAIAQSYNSDYYLYLYSQGAWAPISDFPVSNMATDGTRIFCSKYDTTGQLMPYVFQYDGASWTQLPKFPVENDFPAALAVSKGVLYARANNSGAIYSYDGSWSPVTPPDQSASSLTGSNSASGYLGYIGTDQTPYLYNGSIGETEVSGNLNTIVQAQSVAGAQYQISTDQNLFYCIVEGGSPVDTQVATNAIYVTASPDSGKPVYTDGTGQTYYLSGSPGDPNSNWIAFPAIPDQANITGANA